MAKRLFIAFVVLGLVSGVLWRLPPDWGLVSLRWWVPLIGFVIIAFGVVLPQLGRMKRTPSTPEPTDASDPGPSQADLERFGDSPLRLTDRDP
jgi:hypothetical protein